MPNKKSAKRRVKTEERNRIYNRYWTTRCKNAVKKVLESVAAGDKEAAGKNLDLAQSVIDMAVVKGVMHRNTASRRKKLISRHVKSLVEA